MPGDETRIVKGWSPDGVPTIFRLTADGDLRVTSNMYSDIEITVTPTISAGVAYAAGDALGNRMRFINAVSNPNTHATIVKVTVIDDDDEMAPIDIVFFDRPFGATADNSPFDPTDADLQNCLGYVDVAATDYASFNDNAVAAKTSGLRMPFQFYVPAGRSLYAQMVIREAHTYTAVDDLTIKLTIERH